MSPLARRQRRAGDRGATLIELSLVALLVFTAILGLIEFGLLFRDNLTATDAVSDATRIGAIVGPDVRPVPSGGADPPPVVTADYEIVKALREGLSSMSADSVRSIVIFRAPGTSEKPEDQVPPQCRNGISVRNVCNAYPAASAFAAVEHGNHSYFTCDDPSGAEISCHWDPVDRIDGPLPSDVQTIGVYVHIVKDGFTGLFADSWTIDRAATARLEPGTIDP